MIPVLLLARNGLVKSRQFRRPVYVGDPLNALRVFSDKCVDEIVLLDIEATPQNRAVDLGRVRDLAQECFVPLAYGGGVRDFKTIEQLVRSGIEKVILNTSVVENPEFLSRAALEFGTSTIVAAIDVKIVDGKPRVFSRAGSKPAGRDPVDLARELADRGAGEIFLQSIDRDGMRQGYDLALIRQVAESVPLSVIACGGAGNAADLRSVLDLGCSAAAGSLFVLYGRLQSVLITYPKAVDLGRVEDVWA